MIPDKRRNEFPCQFLREFFVDWFDDFSAILHRFFVSMCAVSVELLVIGRLELDTGRSTLPTQTDEGKHDDEMVLKVAPP